MDFVKAEEPLALELYLTQAGFDGNSLIASLTDYELAEDEKIWADIYWSLDNVNFQKESIQDVYWAVDGRKLYRPCLLSTHEALAKYLAGGLDAIYVKLEVHSSLGFSKWTEVEVLKKPLPGEDVMSVKAIYPGIPMQMMMGSFRNRYAQYHVTVTENENGYADVLPKTIPVAFSLVSEENLPYGDRMLDHIVPYDVFWEESEDTENTYVAVSMQSRIEEDYFFVAGNQNFCIEKSLFPINPLEELSQMRMNNWYCTVHPVPVGYATDLVLEEDTDMGVLSAQLPLKPTGMTRIEIEVSTDGEENWHLADSIMAAENPVDYMPKEEGYSVRILSKEKVESLLSEGKGTFHVRLKIVNGALGNQYALEDGDGDTYTYSQSAVWTGPYVELPPEEDGTGKDENPDAGNGSDNEDDDSNKDDDFSAGNEEDDDGGSGGNNGNVGSDNSGESEGQRPGVDASPKDEDTQMPPENPDDTLNGDDENIQNPSDDNADDESPQNPSDNNGNDESQQPPSNNGNGASQQPPSNNGNDGSSQSPSNNGNDGSSQSPSNNGNDGSSQSPSDNNESDGSPQSPSDNNANDGSGKNPSDDDKSDKNDESVQPPSKDNENDENIQSPSDDNTDDESTQNSSDDNADGQDASIQNPSDNTINGDGSRDGKITAAAAGFGIVAAGCAAGAAAIKLGILPRLLEWIIKRKHR